MVGMKICLAFTVVALLCQALGIFLPGWRVYQFYVQYGVWYICIDWKNCGHYFDQVKGNIMKGGLTETDANRLILIVTESLAFLLLAVASAVAGMGACSKRSYFTLLCGLNMAACFLILCGVVSSMTLYAEFGYAFYLACSGAFLSLVSGCLTCCFSRTEGKSSYSSRQQEDPAFKQYNDQQYYQDYQHQQQNYPMGYGGAAPFYG